MQTRMVLTERLEVRLPVAADRARFVDLFQDPAFMQFSDGVHDRASAGTRFDVMLETAGRVPFAKQPVIERSSGEIVGYIGAAWCAFAGASRLEFGYRLVPSARRQGYATEAGLAVLSLAADSFRGELLAMIDPLNVASRSVIGKLGSSIGGSARSTTGTASRCTGGPSADEQSEQTTARWRPKTHNTSLMSASKRRAQLLVELTPPDVHSAEDSEEFSELAKAWQADHADESVEFQELGCTVPD